MEAERPRSALELFLSEYEEIPSWIKGGFLPKRSTVIVGGEAKIGKTFILMELARCLLEGFPAFGHPNFDVPEPCRVLVIERELGVYGLVQRLKDSLKGLPEYLYDIYAHNFFFVTGEPRVKFCDTEGTKLIRGYIEETRPNVVIFDPVGKMHGVDENSSRDVEGIFKEMDLLKQEFSEWDLTIIFSHHFAKRSTSPDARHELDPYNFRGSTKWFDNPDAVITASRKVEYSGSHKWWDDHVRMVPRHAEQPDDFKLSINEFNDRRVRFKYELDEKGKKKV